MFLRMLFRQKTAGARMIAIGVVLMAMGMLLILVWLLAQAPYLGGVVLGLGLVVMLVGVFMKSREKVRRHDLEDEIPYF